MAQTAPPALNSHDRLLRLNDAEVERGAETKPDSVVDVDLPLLGGDAAGLGVVNGVDTSRQVELSGSLLVSGDADDGALGSVLGQEAGRDTAALVS